MRFQPGNFTKIDVESRKRMPHNNKTPRPVSACGTSLSDHKIYKCTAGQSTHNRGMPQRGKDQPSCFIQQELMQQLDRRYCEMNSMLHQNQSVQESERSGSHDQWNLASLSNVVFERTLFLGLHPCLSSFVPIFEKQGSDK